MAILLFDLRALSNMISHPGFWHPLEARFSIFATYRNTLEATALLRHQARDVQIRRLYNERTQGHILLPQWQPILRGYCLKFSRDRGTMPKNVIKYSTISAFLLVSLFKTCLYNTYFDCLWRRSRLDRKFKKRKFCFSLKQAKKANKP